MPRRTWALRFAVSITLAIASGCGFFSKADEKNGTTATIVGPTQFFSTVSAVEVQVAYEPGAEPYTDTIGNGIDVWRILEENLSELFAKRTSPPSLVVTTELAAMQSIPAQQQKAWTGVEIMNLSAQYNKAASDLSTARFWIVFLDGYYDRGGEIDENVIGVSLTGTTVIAMFKPVIRELEKADRKIASRFVEQATLVHEMGHALGLVANGVPLASPHHDSEHGAHCSNQNCVMFWLNEGKTDVLQFVSRYFLQQTFVMFDDACLDDVASISQ